MIVIVDYGLGNLHSVLHKIQKITPDVKLSSKPDDIEHADKLILPGVGQYASGMKNLAEYGLIGPLNKKVLKDGTPILGVCLGMQLFTDYGEEGGADGLGWIAGRTIRLKPEGLPVPHVGWNTIKIKKETKLFNGLPQDYRYYFTHSYHVVCQDHADILTTTKYGQEFTSAIQKNNVYGTQFHPEKSHTTGVTLIKNFIYNVYAP
jgi:glutamine amidotransferase